MGYIRILFLSTSLLHYAWVGSAQIHRVHDMMATLDASHATLKGSSLYLFWVGAHGLTFESSTYRIKTEIAMYLWLYTRLSLAFIFNCTDFSWHRVKTPIGVWNLNLLKSPAKCWSNTNYPKWFSQQLRKLEAHLNGWLAALCHRSLCQSQQCSLSLH